MKIIFMGSDKIALGVLEVLKRRASELIVVSQPDKPSGRGQKLTPNVISTWALENDTKLLRPEKLDESFLQELKNFTPDISFVMAYGRILKAPVIDLPRLGTWNFHASLLPQLRGASPIETAIALGEKETGVALMKMVLALDAGPVGPVEKAAIGSRTTSAEMREAIGAASYQLLEKNWEALVDGNLSAVPQVDARATYCRTLSKEDAWLDPSAAAEEISQRVRAFGRNIGSLLLHGDERLKVFGARALSESFSQPPGTIVEASPRFIMAAGQGSLEILELQRAGGKALSAGEFLRGYPLKVGDKFIGRPHRPLVDAKPFPRNF